MKIQRFPLIQVGVLDFRSHKHFSFEFCKEDRYLGVPRHYFDLASLTKPLTLSVPLYYHQELIDDDTLLLLNHKAGLPAFGKPSKDFWKELIESYKIKSSPTLYSDYGPLRLMLEIEKRSKVSLKTLWEKHFGDYSVFWKDLGGLVNYCAPTGFRKGKVIQGTPNDDNAFNFNEFCSHAGLFSKMDIFLKGIERLWEDGLFSWVDNHAMGVEERFVMGMDRPFGKAEPLASLFASKSTYGHLGFTGTSFWVDVEKKIGLIIFTNETSAYAYNRYNLNHLRRSLGEFVFSKGLK